MRKLLLGFMMLVAVPVLAQDTTMITVPRSSLTSAQLAQAKAAELGKWAGLGKEVGEAVNSSLSAVTEQTSKFADTRIGKITTFIVIWKVIGKEVLAVLFAGGIVLLGFPFLVWSYFRTAVDHKVLKKSYKDERGKTVKEYQTIEGSGDAQGGHVAAAFIILIIISIALFAS